MLPNWVKLISDFSIHTDTSIGLVHLTINHNISYVEGIFKNPDTGCVPGTVLRRVAQIHHFKEYRCRIGWNSMIERNTEQDLEVIP